MFAHLPSRHFGSPSFVSARANGTAWRALSPVGGTLLQGATNLSARLVSVWGSSGRMNAQCLHVGSVRKASTCHSQSRFIRQTDCVCVCVRVCAGRVRFQALIPLGRPKSWRGFARSCRAIGTANANSFNSNNSAEALLAAGPRALATCKTLTARQMHARDFKLASEEVNCGRSKRVVRASENLVVMLTARQIL